MLDPRSPAKRSVSASVWRSSCVLGLLLSCRLQPEHFEVSLLGVTADFVPLIFFFHPLACRFSGRFSGCRLSNQEAKTIARIVYVATTNVKPAPSTASRFSGTSLAERQPAPIASSKANESPSMSKSRTK